MAAGRHARQAPSTLSPAQPDPVTGVIASDGKIVAVGKTSAWTAMAIARFTSSGVLDTTFSSDGKQVSPAQAVG